MRRWRNTTSRSSIPNREKAASKATRAVVVALLLASAFLMIVISVGAWDALAGAKPLQVIYIVLYLASPSSCCAGAEACCRSPPRWRSCC